MSRAETLIGKRFFTLTEVARWTGLSKSTVLRYEERGDFPMRKRLGRNRVGWDIEDLEAWARAREPAVGQEGLEG